MLIADTFVLIVLLLCRLLPTFLSIARARKQISKAGILLYMRSHRHGMWDIDEYR